jgi:hypothetical protein
MNKSIFTKEELVLCDKEYLSETILRLEKDKIYWFEELLKCRDEHQKTLKEFINFIDKQ